MSPHYMTSPSEAYTHYNQQQRCNVSPRFHWSYCERRNSSGSFPDSKTPYSPPHQPYDPDLSVRYYYHHVPKDIPSPPMQPRPNYRRMSCDSYKSAATLPPPSPNKANSPCEKVAMIRLPPLRDIVCHVDEKHKEIGEVDAAVAMMQLAHHQGQKSTAFIESAKQSRLLRNSVV
ncbi:hypothetical protein DFQ28_002980 [Apophysomyces sp. BC1034]|nr:hypothetical protein DFQ30_006456 [Apophysomyces sp. BC1015]KAG0193828.1 hypothetical protein DFQ28_002980 [Apophysomyces sp. BC1034]